MTAAPRPPAGTAADADAATGPTNPTPQPPTAAATGPTNPTPQPPTPAAGPTNPTPQPPTGGAADVTAEPVTR